MAHLYLSLIICHLWRTAISRNFTIFSVYKFGEALFQKKIKTVKMIGLRSGMGLR